MLSMAKNAGQSGQEGQGDRYGRLKPGWLPQGVLLPGGWRVLFRGLRARFSGSPIQTGGMAGIGMFLGLDPVVQEVTHMWLSREISSNHEFEFEPRDVLSFVDGAREEVDESLISPPPGLDLGDLQAGMWRHEQLMLVRMSLGKGRVIADRARRGENPPSHWMTNRSNAGEPSIGASKTTHFVDRIVDPAVRGVRPPKKTGTGN